MGLYIGADLHSNNCVMGIIDMAGKQLKKKKLPIDKTEILNYLSPYKDQTECIAFESTYNWYWLGDTLADAGYNVKMANPLAMQQYKGLKHTNDESDAFWLAEMLRLDILPTSYIMDKATRAVRDLLRYRMSMVNDRTSLKLALVSVYSRCFGLRMSAKAAIKFNLKELPDQTETVPIKQKIRSLVERINDFDTEITKIEKNVEKSLPNTEDIDMLRTITGIGYILAMTIALEVGDINRFNRVGNFTSYCRCTDAARYSNGKKKGKNLSKCGNKYLSWAFSEAAEICRIHCLEAKRFYDRKLSAKSIHILANRALATKLCKAAFHVLTSKQEFSIEKCFGYKID